MMIQSNCLSEVDVKLSQVNVLMSEINQLISQCPVPVQSRKLLPRINVILSEMTFVVSYAQTDSSSGDDSDDGSLIWDSNYTYSNNANYNSYYSLFHADAESTDEGDERADEADISKNSNEHEEDVDMIPVGHEEIDMTPVGHDKVDMTPVGHEKVNMKVGDDAIEDIDDGEDDYDNIATRVMARRRSSIHPDEVDWLVSSPEDVDGSFISLGDVDSRPIQANSFTSSLLTFISRVAPGDVFSTKKSARRRKRKRSKMVHPELKMIWQNFDKIFPSRSNEDTEECSILPQVDWSKVNQRLIKNVPEPLLYPVHGVSPDPEFYKMIRENNLGGWPPASQFHDTYPFGTKHGYYTSAGVIPPVFGDVIHGYVWSEEDKRYVIHAKVGSERKKNAKKGGVNVPKKSRRKELR